MAIPNPVKLIMKTTVAVLHGQWTPLRLHILVPLQHTGPDLRLLGPEVELADPTMIPH